MRAIINRSRYDTDRASSVVVWSNEVHTSDFNWVQETLYRTERGAYFLHGQGGALSKYRVPTGNNGTVSGEQIIPLTNEAAMDWLESKELVKHLEAEFGESIEDA
jgi:hypothetical protein